jgi:hypothetical protein
MILLMTTQFSMACNGISDHKNIHKYTNLIFLTFVPVHCLKIINPHLSLFVTSTTETSTDNDNKGDHLLYLF